MPCLEERPHLLDLLPIDVWVLSQQRVQIERGPWIRQLSSLIRIRHDAP